MFQEIIIDQKSKIASVITRPNPPFPTRHPSCYFPLTNNQN